MLRSIQTPRGLPVPLAFPFNHGAIITNAMNVLTANGATVVTVGALAAQLGGCSSRPPAANFPPAPGCSTLNYGFKRDLNKYIEDHVGNRFPIKSLTDVVIFNIAFGPAARKYDQDLAIFSDFLDLAPNCADTPRYQSDRAADIVNSRGAIAAVLNGPDGVPGTSDDFDALLFSGNSGAGTPAKAGDPSSSFREGSSKTTFCRPIRRPIRQASPRPVESPELR